MTDVETHAADRPRAHSNPYTLWFVMLSFVAPVAAAYYMFFFGEISSFSNNGEFIRPVVRLEQLALTRPDASVFDKQSLDKKWHIMALVGKDCDPACQQSLINLRQISRAVKRPVKIRHVLVSTAAAGETLQQFIASEMSGAVMLQGDANGLQRVLSSDAASAASSYYYLSDYHGNLVMKFSSAMAPKLIIKDLNRLF